jgi:ATP-dependent exoDNAse (exonuclease V) beta subunit
VGPRGDEAIVTASRREIVVRKATDRRSEDAKPSPDAKPALEPPHDVELVEISGDRRRPTGARFGALVHAVLAVVSLRASAEEVARVTALESRILGAPPDEIAAAQETVIRVLTHPLMTRAAAAADLDQCRRETPLTLREEDGTIVDGVVDLAFREDETWTVVDFKTDREIATELDAYRTQVTLYATAIAAATGQATRAVLVRV